jgi:hypothetical protein
MAKLATFQLLDEEWIGKCTLFLHDVILADQWKFNFFKKKKKKKKKKEGNSIKFSVVECQPTSSVYKINQIVSCHASYV